MPHSLSILVYSLENKGHDKGILSTRRCLCSIQNVSTTKASVPSLSLSLVHSLDPKQTPTCTRAHKETLFQVGAGDGAMTTVPRHVNELFTSVPSHTRSHH